MIDRYKVMNTRTVNLAFEEIGVKDVRISSILESLIAPAILPRGSFNHQVLLALREVIRLLLLLWSVHTHDCTLVNLCLQMYLVQLITGSQYRTTYENSFAATVRCLTLKFAVAVCFLYTSEQTFYIIEWAKKGWKLSSNLFG